MRNSLKKIFDSLLVKYSNPNYLNTDPIQFVHVFSNPQDQELVGFISALFAYGNVKSILKYIKNLLNLLGNTPSQFILETKNLQKIKTQILGYRFQTSEDVYQFLLILGILWQKSNTLESYFTSQGSERIINFQKKFWQTYSNYFSLPPTRGLKFLVGFENPKSPNKRYWLFLRWMVRNTYPDLGIYKTISPSELLYPLDTHIQKLTSILGMSLRKTNDIDKVIEITTAFQEFCREDPVKYDFSLSRLGILKQCKETYEQTLCSICILKVHCNLMGETNK